MLGIHQDSGQSSTQQIYTQNGQLIPQTAQTFNPIHQNAMTQFQFPQPLNRNISEVDQNDISDAFIDLDIFFLENHVQKKAHIKLCKDKNKESKELIGDIKLGSKEIFAKSLINIRYNKETKDILEQCLWNSFKDQMLYEKLFGPYSEIQNSIFIELQTKLKQIRDAIK